ncbi:MULTISPECIES: hypothetical protein [Helcococcus]|uniref:Uncharacterized protein n=2 Tax=Helcococcus bovis TaxID=3153252 RepID=A0ABW9F593_9FIRM
MKDGKVEDGYLISSHGYLNDHKDYETVFFASGLNIKKNFEILDMSLVDE